MKNLTYIKQDLLFFQDIDFSLLPRCPEYMNIAMPTQEQGKDKDSMPTPQQGKKKTRKLRPDDQEFLKPQYQICKYFDLATKNFGFVGYSYQQWFNNLLMDYHAYKSQCYDINQYYPLGLSLFFRLLPVFAYIIIYGEESEKSRLFKSLIFYLNRFFFFNCPAFGLFLILFMKEEYINLNPKIFANTFLKEFRATFNTITQRMLIEDLFIKYKIPTPYVYYKKILESITNYCNKNLTIYNNDFVRAQNNGSASFIDFKNECYQLLKKKARDYANNYSNKDYSYKDSVIATVSFMKKILFENKKIKENKNIIWAKLFDLLYMDLDLLTNCCILFNNNKNSLNEITSEFSYNIANNLFINQAQNNVPTSFSRRPQQPINPYNQQQQPINPYQAQNNVPTSIVPANITTTEQQTGNNVPTPYNQQQQPINPYNQQQQPINPYQTQKVKN